MSGDIVERQNWYCRCGLDNHGHLLLERAKTEIAWLRAAGDDMAEALRATQGRGAASAFMAHRALIRWEEARRG